MSNIYPKMGTGIQATRRTSCDQKIVFSNLIGAWAPDQATLAMAHLDPEGLNGTNLVRLHVFANEAEGHAVLVALLDNLGKGASGQAVQNMNLMLGLAEDTGLEAAPAAA